ncbi:MAG: SGNH/GDSL hydrolase family protein [Pseudomonadota bacterium]
MSDATLAAQLRQNVARLNDFIQGDEQTDVVLDDDSTYPSIRKFLSETVLDLRINHEKTVEQWKTTEIPSIQQSLNASGYYAPGDGGAGRWVKDTAASLGSFASADGAHWKLDERVIDPRMLGVNLDVSLLTSEVAVDAHWARMRDWLSYIRQTPGVRAPDVQTIITAREVFAEWASGRNCPIGFYSDSTTDGSQTTDHVRSEEKASGFGVTITESPNAYPKKIESYVDIVLGKSTTARCYNGGFDGKSFRGNDDFGLRNWFNVWFQTGATYTNVNFSDVRMIVIGFGTSDSINLDDTAAVIDDYATDLECVIVDCFLRGVQPALQTPVITIQHAGTTVNYRNARESITIIEAIQKRLAQKYNLEHFSYGEAWREAIDNFEGKHYRDFMADDQIHPNDEGHRVHAAHLVCRHFTDHVMELGEHDRRVQAFPGDPFWTPGDETDVFGPPGEGGTILQITSNVNESIGSHMYEWLAAEGNGKTAGELLMEIPVYVTKPAFASLVVIDNDRTAAKTYDVVNYTEQVSQDGVQIIEETHEQPVGRTYADRVILSPLAYGLNVVKFYASADDPDQRLGPFEVHSFEEFTPFSVNMSSGAARFVRQIERPVAPADYTVSFNRHPMKIGDYYNAVDNQDLVFSLQLGQAFAASTVYSVYTHFNSIESWMDAYNLIEFEDDTITLKVKANASTALATIGSNTISGLRALLLQGSLLQLKFRPQFVSASGQRLQVWVDGVNRGPINTSVGETWSRGWGLLTDGFRLERSDIFVETQLRGSVGLDAVF